MTFKLISLKSNATKKHNGVLRTEEVRNWQNESNEWQISQYVDVFILATKKRGTLFWWKVDGCPLLPLWPFLLSSIISPSREDWKQDIVRKSFLLSNFVNCTDEQIWTKNERECYYVIKFTDFTYHSRNL